MCHRCSPLLGECFYFFGFLLNLDFLENFKIFWLQLVPVLVANSKVYGQIVLQFEATIVIFGEKFCRKQWNKLSLYFYKNKIPEDRVLGHLVLP